MSFVRGQGTLMPIDQVDPELVAGNEENAQMGEGEEGFGEDGGEQGFGGEGDEDISGEGSPEDEIPEGEEVPPGEGGEETGEEGDTGSEETGDGDDIPEADETGDEEPDPGADDNQPDNDPEDDEDDQDVGNPFAKKNPKGRKTSTMGNPVAPVRGGAPRRRVAAAPNPAGEERKALITAVNTQSKLIREQYGQLRQQGQLLRAISKKLFEANTHLRAQAVRSDTLDRQMAHLANVSGQELPLAQIGVVGRQKVAAIYRTANPANPAQPVPEPPAQGPVETSQGAVQADGRDDVTQLGASPVTDVSADAVTSGDVPYGELANQPVGMNRVDVTAPVAGTQEPNPPNETIIPVDVRIGNPDNPEPMFPWDMGPVAGSTNGNAGGGGGEERVAALQAVTASAGELLYADPQARLTACFHLADLRVRTGISEEEPVGLAAKLANSGIKDLEISTEIRTLEKMANVTITQRQVTAQSVPEGRVLVPRLASNSRTSEPIDPSLQASKYGSGPGAAIANSSQFAPQVEEFGLFG